jgi:hypothetical protein
VGFTQAELQFFRNVSVPDLIERGVKLLFVGINPGLWTAATQTSATSGSRTVLWIPPIDDALQRLEQVGF